MLAYNCRCGLGCSCRTSTSGSGACCWQARPGCWAMGACAPSPRWPRSARLLSPLRWTTKSLRHLPTELARQRHAVSASTVGRLLREQALSLQGTAKTLEGAQHPERDAQFRYSYQQVTAQQADGEPVISVDA